MQKCDQTRKNEQKKRKDENEQNKCKQHKNVLKLKPAEHLSKAIMSKTSGGKSTTVVKRDN